MLISRYNVLSRSLGRRMGGTTQSGDRADFGKNGAVRNRFQTFARFTSTPSGYVAPYAWIPAQVGGGMATFTTLRAGGSLVAALSGGRNISAALSASGTLTPPEMALIVSMAATITATGVLTPPVLAGVIFAAASLSASGSLNAPTLGAIVSGAAALSASGSLSASIRADGLMSAAISNAAASDAPTADEIAATIMSYVVEDGLDLAALLRVLLSAHAGNATLPESGSGSYEFLARDGTTPRVAGTIAAGVRTVTDVDGSP